MTDAAVETEADFGEPPSGIVRRWVAEIEAFERERAEWHDRVDRIEARYRNVGTRDDDARRFALLWANVEVLKPTIYARDPVPRAFRRFRDRDPIGRIGGQLLERVLACQVEREGSYREAAEGAVLDLLLGGQGVGWVFYEPKIGTVLSEPVIDELSGEMIEPSAPMPVKEDERARLVHVHRRDFGFTAGARNWEEVTAVWRVAYMTRAALVERFGERGQTVPLDRAPPDRAQREERGEDVFGKASIYEVWDSATRTTIWLHKGEAEPLDVRPYPVRLRGRFPCPRPMFATLTTNSTVPVPDYVYYRDQAAELDDLTARIGALRKALKMIGFVPGDAQPDIQKGLDSEADVALVPVESWAMGQGRPMDNAIAWMPIREVAETLDRLIVIREQVKRDAYEVTGLSDILRGQTQASETATAQQIKAQWGGIRVRRKQAEVARWCREAIEIMADIVCGHFDPGRITAEANVGGMQPEDQQRVPEALELLRGENAFRVYRIDVETDSTIAPDEAGEREAATELLTGVAGFLGQTMPMLGGVAASAPHAVGPMAEMIGGLLTMAVRRFRGGDEAEEMVERAMQALARPPAVPMMGVGPAAPMGGVDPADPLAQMMPPGLPLQ